ncbi:hypothetical protein G9A89_005324 [Geosiphon pyriformis]|nr:hypothetical protein G9A89_005324 [Geosiphon pyriformis]
MELTSFSAGGSSSVLVGLGTHSGVKSKCLAGVHSHGASYKKPKKPVAVSGMINMSVGPLSLEDLGKAGAKSVVSWGSNVGSILSSVSGFSNMKNMTNLVTEETSYAESGENDDMDNTTLRKTCTRTYAMGNPIKQTLFNNVSDDSSVLELLFCLFSGSNQLPLLVLHALEKRSFDLTKSFALDIELSAIPGKTNNDKLFSLKKNFYRIDGFGGASTPSKFSGIIRFSFTSEISLNKAQEIGNHNSQGDPGGSFQIGSKVSFFQIWQDCFNQNAVDWSLAKDLVFMGKDLVRVALHRALLYTFPVGTNVHDLSSLLESYGGKTCYIGRNLNSYVCNRCAVICFGDEASKLAAIGTILVFKGVSLHWAGLSLASCTDCKQFSHVMVNCFLGEYSGVRGKRVVSEQDWICLAGIYKKKSAPIAPQVAGGSLFCVISSGLVGAGLHSGLVPSSMVTDSPTVFYLNDRLAILERSLELLTDHVSKSIDLVPVATPFLSLLPTVSETLTSNVNSDMIMDTALVLSGIPLSVVHDAVVELSFSSSKVLTAKVGGLETKLIALEASVSSVLDKLNILCSDSGLSVPLSSQ